MPASDGWIPLLLRTKRTTLPRWALSAGQLQAMLPDGGLFWGHSQGTPSHGAHRSLLWHHTPAWCLPLLSPAPPFPSAVITLRAPLVNMCMLIAISESASWAFWPNAGYNVSKICVRREGGKKFMNFIGSSIGSGRIEGRVHILIFSCKQKSNMASFHSKTLLIKEQ